MSEAEFEDACQKCGQLDGLLRHGQTEAVVIRGRHDRGEIEWVVDVVATIGSGRGKAETLIEAVHQAMVDVGG